MTPERRERPRGQGLAIVLIVVGVLILLANFGWFDWFTLARLANLWPILLLAIGADMLTRGRYRAAVWVAAIVLGAALYAYDGGGPRGVLGGGPAAVHSVAQPLAGARAAQVSITTGVGSLRLSGGAPTGQLVTGTIGTGPGEALLDDLTHTGSTAVLRLSSQQPSGVRFGAGVRREWDLKLSEQVPLALSITTGVGQARLDLRDVKLSDLRMQSGVGEVSATLPASGVYQADFKAGVGATRITLPAGLAARVTVQSGLGAVHVNGTFSRSGDVYETPGYAAAGNRVELRVEGGLGQITVDRQ